MKPFRLQNIGAIKRDVDDDDEVHPHSDDGGDITLSEYDNDFDTVSDNGLNELIRS